MLKTALNAVQLRDYLSGASRKDEPESFKTRLTEMNERKVSRCEAISPTFIENKGTRSNKTSISQSSQTAHIGNFGNNQSLSAQINLKLTLVILSICPLKFVYLRLKLEL
ncbi:hypothetical protein IAD21_05944 [Abditibacteriota bacterium]|nr:hypothetical protein IAD21_05944 [Abditibacteriota bacterium]